MDTLKSDWNMYQLKVPEWQERYMDRLLKEYLEALTDETRGASEKFWYLEKRIRSDKRNPGVFIALKKLEMQQDVALMIKKEIISMDDLTGFSDSFIAQVNNYL